MEQLVLFLRTTARVGLSLVPVGRARIRARGGNACIVGRIFIEDVSLAFAGRGISNITQSRMRG